MSTKKNLENVTVPDMSTEEFLRYASEQIGHPMEDFLKYMRPHMRDFMKDARGKSFEIAIEELEDGGDMEEELFEISFKGNLAAFITWALRERPLGYTCVLLSKEDRLSHEQYGTGEVWDGTLDFSRRDKTESESGWMCFGIMSEYGFGRVTLNVLAFREIKS